MALPSRDGLQSSKTFGLQLWCLVLPPALEELLVWAQPGLGRQQSGTGLLRSAATMFNFQLARFRKKFHRKKSPNISSLFP